MGIYGLVSDAVNALDEAADLLAADDRPGAEAILNAIEEAKAAADKVAGLLNAADNPRARGEDDGVEYADPRERDW